ncbi:MAG: transcription antitermination factor NusB [Chlamydiia bacterium]|nr:transcription antitermination factor NusB [Chlamydiia bacterium]MCP5492805.1 transcription antitermination factor NusB [Chlamydiales bacterium]
MDPRKMREAVYQIAYALNFEADGDDVVKLVSSQLKINQTHAKNAYARACLLMEKASELDAAISVASKEYALDRIPKAELTILRLGAFELLFDDDVPEKVAISEAIRLARKFVTSDGARFINAALDALIPEKSIA